MNRDNFESIISGLTKGAANIESVNFHFGDCNSTTYMGGEVEEEYVEEYGSEGCCDCGCCPGGFPVVDSEEAAKWVQKKTGIDLDTVHKVLDAEEEYLEEIGVSVPVDFDSGIEGQDGRPEKKAEPVKGVKPFKDVKPVTDDQLEKAEPEQDGKPDEKALDEMLDKALDGIMPGLLCMGLMGALFDGIFNPGKSGGKEQKHGKDE